ncbi:MAG: lipoate--protein ligase [Ruminococcaceae bacterium]|nr:lipoate--protein ligase [Oscillospiraceae bacterium]
MIYIDTKSSDIYYNLAAEYYFAAEKKIDGAENSDIFMLWKTTPTIIIGRFQNLFEEVNLPHVREKGITLARRLSGGGTIYSDEKNLMFTFISPETKQEINFEKFVRPIIDSLSLLGVKAELSGRNDIMIDGRKISGNAQYRAGGAVVHHGTLLLDSDLEEIVRSTTPKDYKITSKAIKSVRERVTNLSEHLQFPMTPDELKEHIAKTICSDSYEISRDDDIRIRQISNEKFDDEKIVFAASPKFEIEKTIHTSGGEFDFTFTVRGGKIESASVSGDFFANLSPDDIVNVLVGCEYTPSAVEAAFDSISSNLFRTTPHDLAIGLFE